MPSFRLPPCRNNKTFAGKESSSSRTPDLVKSRREFAMWAFSKNHTPEEIAAILKISSRSVRIWSIAVKKVENAKNES
jgi:hypothetical protein